MKTITLIVTVLFLFVNLIDGQPQHILDDTISIGDVNVIGRLINGESGYKVTHIDNEKISFSGGLSLSHLLARNSSLGIKNYGSEGLATASFRGMGANQTKVYWEGIPINSSGNGQVDLSIVPVSRFNRIEIYHGSSPVSNGTNGPGGTISLVTIPDWKNGTDVIFSHTFGSFGLMSDEISLIGGSDNFQFISQAFFKNSDNNYNYIDRVNYSSPRSKTRVHNQSVISGLGQNFFVKSGKSILSANLLYNHSDRELPGPIISDNQQGENQIDKQFRMAIGLKKYSTFFSSNFKIGFISDYLKYNNNLISLISEYQGRTAYLNGSIRYQPKENSSVKISFSNRFNTIESVNHSGYKQVNQAILRVQYDTKIRDKLSLLIMSEANHANGKFYLPAGSIGFDLLLEKSERLYLKGNIGNSITIPTLNDLYWSPGGNPNLNVESGINGELTLELREGNKAGLNTSGEVTLYNSRLKNMIKWLPGDYGIWSPINISEINSYGTELDFNISYLLPDHDLGINMRYIYSRVYDMNEIITYDEPNLSQLLYVPLNQAICELRYSTNAYSLSWVSDFTGLRYTSSDNSALLPGFVTSDIEFGFKFKLGTSRLNTLLRISNILNSEYEYIAFYPVPGRNYSLTLTYSFKTR